MTTFSLLQEAYDLAHAVRVEALGFRRSHSDNPGEAYRSDV